LVGNVGHRKKGILVFEVGVGPRGEQEVQAHFSVLGYVDERPVVKELVHISS